MNYEIHTLFLRFPNYENGIARKETIYYVADPNVGSEYNKLTFVEYSNAMSEEFQDSELDTVANVMGLSPEDPLNTFAGILYLHL